MNNGLITKNLLEDCLEMINKLHEIELNKDNHIDHLLISGIERVKAAIEAKLKFGGYKE